MDNSPKEEIQKAMVEIMTVLDVKISASQWNKLEEILSGLMLKSYLKGEEQTKKSILLPSVLWRLVKKSIDNQ